MVYEESPSICSSVLVGLCKGTETFVEAKDMPGDLREGQDYFAMFCVCLCLSVVVSPCDRCRARL